MSTHSLMVSKATSENQHFSTTPKFADGGEKKHHPNNFWWSTPIFVIKTNFCGQDQFFSQDQFL
jgi:hypothetical protein